MHGLSTEADLHTVSVRSELQKYVFFVASQSKGVLFCTFMTHSKYTPHNYCSDLVLSCPACAPERTIL